MNLINSLFNKQKTPNNKYVEFWNWFSDNEQRFHHLVKEGKNIHEDFFQELTTKLDEIRDGYWFLVGMKDDQTAELIFTPDGIIKNIAFVEDLVKVGPNLTHWNFIALKPALDIENVVLEMEGFTFNKDNISFYSIEHPNYPDEIDIVIVYDDYEEEQSNKIINGIYLFLDNYLGELNSVTMLDNLSFVSPSEAQQELIPISKLKDFLIWREKEFIEKYQGERHNTQEDNYSLFDATLENGMSLLATINVDLLKWERKASHPWIAVVEMSYDGAESGMPDEDTYNLMNDIEDDILNSLKDTDGYLNVGRQTADSLREIYFACIDFRIPSKILDEIKQKYQDKIDFDFDIYKDKYWQTFNRFVIK